MPLISGDAKFVLKSLERDIFSLTLLRHRHFDAHVATMRESGSHWLKYMLSLVLARLYELPSPRDIKVDDFVGGPRTPPRYSHIPQIALSHSTPHVIMRSPAVMRHLRFPKYVILVRDIRGSLVSNYEKWMALWKQNGAAKPADFSAFIRGGCPDERYKGDILGRIMFMNKWGAMIERWPDRTCVVRYEDLRADTVAELQRLCGFLGLEGASPALLAEVAERSSKSRMAGLPKPETVRNVIRTDDHRERAAWFSAADYDYVAALARKHLKHDFGYRYESGFRGD